MTNWYSSPSSTKPLDRLLLTYPTLDQIMNEVDLIAELKSFNSKLLEYLTNTPDLIRQLVEFVIVEPRQSDTNERKYKYPLQAVEMVQTEAVCIANGFFKECLQSGFKMNLEYLYSILDHKSPLILSAGYFFRINNCLLNLKFKQLTEFVYQRPDIFKRLLQHSNMVTITNTMQILLSLDASKAGAFIEQRKNLKVDTILAVINKLRQDSNDPTGDSIQNLTNILVEVIEKYYLIADGNSMLQPILSAQSIDIFIELSLCGNPIVAIPMMSLLISIINYYSFSSMNNEDKQSSEATQKNIERIDSQPVVQIICRNFDRFMCIVEDSPRIGLISYKTLELLCHSVSLSSKNILSTIKRTKYLEMLLDLLFRHENSNITHTLIERTFLHLFVNEKKFYEEYKYYIFCGMNIIAKTAGRIVNEKFQQVRSKGYFGHLMRIIKIYSTIQTTDQNIIKVIRQNSELWAKVTREVIKPHEQISFKQLGTYDISYNPQPIEFKVKQITGTILPQPRPKNDVLEALNDEYSSWSKQIHAVAGTGTHDSIMNEKDSLFKQPLDQITSVNHLFEKTDKKDGFPIPSFKTSSLSQLGSPADINRKLEEQIKHQRANSPRNQSFQEFIEKKKLEAQQQLKLQRTLSQEKNRTQFARSPSPRQRKINSWADEQDEDSVKSPGNPNSKKAISKSLIMTSSQQHDRNRKDIPKVRVVILEQPPLEKKYRRIDQKDVQFLNFLGLIAYK